MSPNLRVDNVHFLKQTIRSYRYSEQMYPSRRLSQKSGLQCIAAMLPSTTFIHSLVLSFRRARRIYRPMIPIVLRAFIVIFTAVEMRPTPEHVAARMALSPTVSPQPIAATIMPDFHPSPSIHPSNTTNTTIHQPDFEMTGIVWPFLSRLGIVVASLSAILSVVFFDVKAFNFVTVTAVAVHGIILVLNFGGKHASIISLSAFPAFHCTAIMLSTFVGRRRSITKPTVLRATSVSAKRGRILACLKSVRNVDLLEAGVRAQTCLLALDYASAHTLWMAAFALTLPFAALFFAGYATRKNGVVILMLLAWFAVKNEFSPTFGFNLAKTVSTLGGAFLALSVGPGNLTVDEWIATSKQLCF